MQSKEAVLREAIRELGLLENHRETAKEAAKSLAKRVLRGEKKNTDPVFWPAGLLLMGLTEAALAGNKEAEEAAVSYLVRAAGKDPMITHTDDAVAAYAALRLYEKTGEPKLKDLSDACAAFLKHARQDPLGSIVYNAARNNSYIFADGAGQTALFLSAYGAAFSDEEAVSLGKRQLSNWFSNGLDARTGLPYHGYDAAGGICQGIVGWGRAVGWLLLGAAEVLVSDPAGDLSFPIRKLFADAAGYERQDGLYAWTLPGMRGPVDTSASGMILWAQKRAGLSADPERSEKALLSLTDDEGKVLQCSAECIDFGQYVQQYGSYPWGQGAVCAALWE